MRRDLRADTDSIITIESKYLDGAHIDGCKRAKLLPAGLDHDILTMFFRQHIDPVIAAAADNKQMPICQRCWKLPFTSKTSTSPKPLPATSSLRSASCLA